MIKNGVDIETVARFINRDESFYRAIFTDYEVEYCRNKSAPEQHFCGIYCAKEALSKALSGIVSGMEYHDFCVKHDDFGAPYFAKCPQFKNMKISVSISHTHDTAVAFVTIVL